MGKKIMDIKMRRDPSWGRKSKAGGEKIKSDSIIYTPDLKMATGPDLISRRSVAMTYRTVAFQDRSDFLMKIQFLNCLL